MIYANREQAGKKLARRVDKYLDVYYDVVVLALSRGGVVVGDKIARRLEIPLDLLLVKEISLPGYPDIELGAVDKEGTYALNPANAPHIDAILFQTERLRNIRSANFESDYLSDKGPQVDLLGKQVILVDDGVLTGTSMVAAIDIARNNLAGEIIVASPIMSRFALAVLDNEADAVIADVVPGSINSVSEFYKEFHLESDTKVKDILRAYSAHED